MSDHGEMLGDHGIYLKGPYFYEPAVRVPLIVSWPGTIAGGRSVPEMVELVDLAPTLLDRSEEHTSEIQSLMRNSYAVFCLKKKTKTTELLSIRGHKIVTRLFITHELGMSVHLSIQNT